MSISLSELQTTTIGIMCSHPTNSRMRGRGSRVWEWGQLLRAPSESKHLPQLVGPRWQTWLLLLQPSPRKKWSSLSAKWRHTVTDARQDTRSCVFLESKYIWISLIFWFLHLGVASLSSGLAKRMEPHLLWNSSQKMALVRWNSTSLRLLNCKWPSW